MCELSNSSSVTGAGVFGRFERSCMVSVSSGSGQHRGSRENYRTLNEVLQFPHVARPEMTRESREELL
jgi:hypothetical protein